MAISIERVLEKLDTYFAKNDYNAAERHLKYWYEEAQLLNDDRALLSIVNERIGFYRKQGNKKLSLQSAQEALCLCKKLDMEETITAATAYLNTATAYKAFGMAKEAIPFFEKAKQIYEADLEKDDPRLAGLYNNMALALCDLKNYADAKKYYQKALNTLALSKENALDASITYLNLADTLMQEKGMLDAQQEIDSLLDKAKEILESQKVSTDGYYAFVCEKCAPTFGYYGYFAYKNTLLERAGKIYAGN